MTLEKAKIELENGNIVKSNQCIYIKPVDKIFWKWFGEDVWTEGREDIEDNINEFEKAEEWELVLDASSVS